MHVKTLSSKLVTKFKISKIQILAMFLIVFGNLFVLHFSYRSVISNTNSKSAFHQRTSTHSRNPSSPSNPPIVCFKRTCASM